MSASALLLLWSLIIVVMPALLIVALLAIEPVARIWVRIARQ